MATESRKENSALMRRNVEHRLFAEPYCFEFFQAVRLMQIFNPTRRQVGLFHSPQTESVRFGVRPSLSFPPSELYSLGAEDELNRKPNLSARP